ncbi:MAG: protein kinase domain-containing protein, partial [Candidatus Saccharimonadales bacterium]
VEGQPLSALLFQPLSAERFFPLFTQLLSALQAAHEAGIVHRDIKPSNILVTTGGDARLMDFGLAKHTLSGAPAQSLTQTGALMGSPAYMSPEQCRGEKVDARCDLYSLGCVMYEALTATGAFTGDTPLETMYKHLTEMSPQLPPQFNRSISALIDRALSPEAAQRFPSAQAMLEDLHNCSSQPLCIGKVGASASNRKRAPAIRPRWPVLPVLLGATVISIAALSYFILSRRPGDLQSQPEPHWKYLGPGDARRDAERLFGLMALHPEQSAQLTPRAEAAFEEGIALSNKFHDTSMLPELYQGLAMTLSKSDEARATASFETALSLARQTRRDHVWMMNVLLQYGCCQRSWQHPKEEIKLFTQALAEDSTLGRDSEPARIDQQLAQAYLEDKDPNQAIAWADKGLKCTMHADWIGMLLSTKGDSLKELGKLSEAAACYHQSIGLMWKLGQEDPDDIVLHSMSAGTCEHLADCCRQMKDKRGEIEALENKLLCEKTNRHAVMQDMQYTELCLAKAYRDAGPTQNQKQAYAHLQACIENGKKYGWLDAEPQYQVY